MRRDRDHGRGEVVGSEPQYGRSGQHDPDSVMPGTYSPLAVANEFIRLAGDKGIDHMKLQKLVYYAHGLSLARGRRLVNEQPQVWKLGPVFKSLYFQLKYYGGRLISSPERDGMFGQAPTLDKSDTFAKGIVEEVWRKLRGFTAMQLSDRTHRAGTPWYVTALRHGWRVPTDTEIDGETMRQHFVQNGLNG